MPKGSALKLALSAATALHLASCAAALPGSAPGLPVAEAQSSEEQRRLGRIYLDLAETYDREFKDFDRAAENYARYLAIDPQGEGAARARKRLAEIRRQAPLSDTEGAAPAPRIPEPVNAHSSE